MVRDKELRRLLEKEADRAKREHTSLSAGHQTPKIRERLEELQKRYEEIETLLGRPFPHEHIVRSQKHTQFITLAVASILILFVLLWAFFTLQTRTDLHGIDANIRQLIENYREHGLHPPQD